MAKGPNCALHKVCEGNALHIRGRCANGCAQFQDGSWITKNVCYEPHPGLTSSRRTHGEAEDTMAWLEGEFARNRR